MTVRCRGAREDPDQVVGLMQDEAIRSVVVEKRVRRKETHYGSGISNAVRGVQDRSGVVMLSRDGTDTWAFLSKESYHHAGKITRGMSAHRPLRERTNHRGRKQDNTWMTRVEVGPVAEMPLGQPLEGGTQRRLHGRLIPCSRGVHTRGYQIMIRPRGIGGGIVTRMMQVEDARDRSPAAEDRTQEWRTRVRRIARARMTGGRNTQTTPSNSRLSKRGLRTLWHRPI